MFNLKNEVEGPLGLKNVDAYQRVRGALDPPQRYVHSFSGHLTSTIDI